MFHEVELGCDATETPMAEGFESVTRITRAKYVFTEAKKGCMGSDVRYPSRPQRSLSSIG